MQEFGPRVRKLPWRRAWQHIPLFLPGEYHGQRSLAGCSPRGRTESAITEAPCHAQTGAGGTTPAGCLLPDGPKAQAQILCGDEKLSSEGNGDAGRKHEHLFRREAKY